MLFNSIEFLIFLPLVFLFYWHVLQNRLKAQNLFVLATSYLFYGWWDWRFLGLIILSSIVDYSVGVSIPRVTKKAQKKLLLWLSVGVNIGILGFFKYFNFFIDSFVESFSILGIDLHLTTLSIILPVGISFYTFQTMSYTIDVYRKKMEPTHDIIAFFAYVSFFPQLVAGPIERAQNLLPQFLKDRSFTFENGQQGLRQILWGFFKKVVIADNCAVYVNYVFDNYEQLPSSALVLGVFYFAFQIYGDFSGYSDIAIGTARLFGFDLMKNFAYPYFSRDIAEFWRRWHISLSTWFRDYLYIPLGGSRVGMQKQIRNIFIIFVVSGFWHGANWTFIFWGALNAAYFLPLMLMDKNRDHIEIVAKGKHLPSARDVVNMGITFGITLLAWVFFRAESIGTAFDFLAHIPTASLFAIPYDMGLKALMPLIIFFIIAEWLMRERDYTLDFSGNRKAWWRWSAYLTVVVMIILYGNFSETEFIYFAF